MKTASEIPSSETFYYFQINKLYTCLFKNYLFSLAKEASCINRACNCNYRKRVVWETFLGELFVVEFASAQEPRAQGGKPSVSHLLVGFFICFFCPNVLEETEQSVWETVLLRKQNASWLARMTDRSINQSIMSEREHPLASRPPPPKCIQADRSWKSTKIFWH